MGRFHPDPRVGLSGEQVRQRVQQGLHNGISGIKTKTEGQIIRENVFTFFNILNFALAAAVILVGSFRSAVFLGVIFANIFIGSFQSIRAKRTLDKLSIVSAPKAAVLREGVKKEIPVEQVVLDDILVLSAGNQICSDAAVAAGECEVNESLITGESDPILKRPGDSLLSGSFVVSGSVHAQVEHVGAENYATKIAGDANAFLCMLMIGVNINLQMDSKSFRCLIKHITVRYALSAVLAFLFYRYLPFSLEIRQAMAVIALAPSSSLALIFTMKLKGDVIMAGNICSLSILLSTIAMTILLVYL